MNQLTTDVKQFAYNIGVDHIGITSAEPFYREERRLYEQRAVGQYPFFTERDITKRCFPKQLMSGAQSIISIAVSYLTDDDAKKSFHNDVPRAWVSRYAWCDTDYHHVLANKLEQIVNFLAERAHMTVKAMPIVDTGPPVERSVAERAGVGWFGKNNCIYVPGHGSWVFLGEIVTNVPLTPDELVTKSCGTCTKCIDACPTDAIIGPFRIDPNRCLSYITQMPGVIPREFRRAMGRMLFGCDICQVVCPWNWDASPTNRTEFRPREGLGTRPELIPLLTMTNSQFKKWFGGTAMAWRGKKTIQRNACICLGNIGNKKAVPPLIDRLQNDAKHEVRGAAAWALGEIGCSEAVEALKKRLPEEPSEYVREEIEFALSQAN